MWERRNGEMKCACDCSQNASQTHNTKVDHIHFAFQSIIKNALRYVNSHMNFPNKSRNKYSLRLVIK